MESLRNVLNNKGIYLSAKTIEEKRKKNKLAPDTITGFVENAISKDSVYTKDAISKQKLLESYLQFCEDNGIIPKSSKEFNSTIKSKFMEGKEAVGKKRRTFWLDIKLRDKYRSKFVDVPPLMIPKQIEQRVT
jgi:phage/plasmid-associated DNA primase